MKKMLLSAALLLAAFTANAQNEVGYINPDAVGVTDGTPLTAGTVLGQTEHVTVSVTFDDTFKATGLKGDNIMFNGQALETAGMGIQGNTNGPGSAASEAVYPDACCAYRIEATTDGYVYLFHAASGNKNYVIFMEQSGDMRVPYTFSMENTGGDDIEGGLVSAGTSYAYDLNNIDEALYEIDGVSFVSPSYAILQAGQIAQNTTDGTQYRTTGNGVIKFPVMAGLRYDVLATGSKMTLVAFAFDTTGDADVETTTPVTLLVDGQIPGGGTGISGVEVDNTDNADAPAYNIAGQRVNRNTKGLVIINGKKYINK